MKIKNRNVSFLALTLAGALSLVSLEGVYAGDKGKDKADASIKEFSEKTVRLKDDVSTKRKELGIKSIKSDGKDDGAEKARDRDGQKVRDAEKTDGEKPAITIHEKKDKTIEIKNSSTGNAVQIKRDEKAVDGNDLSVMREVVEIVSRDGLREVTAEIIFEPGKGAEDFLKMQGFMIGNDGTIRGSFRGEQIRLVLENLAFASARDENLVVQNVKLYGFKGTVFDEIPVGIKAPKFSDNVWRCEHVFPALIEVVDHWNDYRDGVSDRGGEFYAGSWSHPGIYMNARIGMVVLDDFEKTAHVWKYLGENKIFPTMVFVFKKDASAVQWFQERYPEVMPQDMNNGRLSFFVGSEIMNRLVLDKGFDGSDMLASFSGLEGSELERLQSYLQASESNNSQ